MTTFIYGLRDSILGSHHQIRYVGQTTGSLEGRLANHLLTARKGDQSWRSHWIREVLMGGRLPVIEELEQVDNERADEAERNWIRRLGVDGRLTNTDHYQSKRNPPVAYVDRLWPDEMKGPYYVRITLSLVEGTLGVTQIVVAGNDPACDPPWTGRDTGTHVALRGRDLQKIPTHRIAAKTLEELTVRWAPLLSRLPSEAAQIASAAIMHAPRTKRGRPRLYGPEHWTEVAQVHASGGMPAVIERWSLSYSTAWRWVKRARDLGL